VNVFVPDANVAANWLLPAKNEPLHAEAVQWLSRYSHGEIHFVVPDLFWAELANVLWKSMRQGRIAKIKAQAALATVKALRIKTLPSLELLDLAFELSERYQRSVHVSLYVALALHAKAQLITADEKLANALAAHLPVKWLGAI
jgi:predicted nucleic acid-binding protein